jgi:hypothetical protein
MPHSPKRAHLWALFPRYYGFFLATKSKNCLRFRTVNLVKHTFKSGTSLIFHAVFTGEGALMGIISTLLRVFSRDKIEELLEIPPCKPCKAHIQKVEQL